MPLVRITGRPGTSTAVFVSEEPIGHLASVYISGERKVREGSNAGQAQVAGVAVGETASGKLVRVVTLGIVSGVICGATVAPGDRVTCINVTSGGGLCSGAGKIGLFNTITPTGVISGYISAVSGSVAAISGYITAVSGWVNLISGVGDNLVGITGTSLSVSGVLLSGLAGVEIIGQPGFRSGAGLITIDSQPGFQSGGFVGTAFLTARVLGKALASGGMGSGIPILVTIGG